MIITLKKGLDEKIVEELIHSFEEKGLEVNNSQGTDYHILGLIGDTTIVDEKRIRANPYIENVTRIAAPYKKANRLFHPEDTVLDVNGIKIGGNEKIVVIGGPCSVEGEKMMISLAKKVKKAGGSMMRGGAYKPRTSPYAFQGLESEGIRCMVKAREITGMPIVSELMDQHNWMNLLKMLILFKSEPEICRIFLY